MKRSHSIPLIFLGTVSGLSGCDNVPKHTEIPVNQDFYNSYSDCQKDWGYEQQNCRPSQTTGSGYSYSGPRYYWYRNENGGQPMALESDGTTRPITSSRISASGAKYAVSSSRYKAYMPTHLTASKSVLRGGFGHFGRSSGGG
jgi:hypothetical protein